jgi:DNA-binding NarL/FixJ family response regulator
MTAHPHLYLLIADDHVIIRRGLKFLLESHFGNLNIAETESCSGILHLLTQHPFTHLILDMQLQDGNVIEIIEQLKNHHPNVYILIYTMSAEDIFGKRMLQLGANGFLNKQSSETEVIRAMDLFFNGKKYISTQLHDLIVQEKKHKGESENPFTNLSEREMEVLLLLLQGKSVKDIAAHFNLKSNTVATFKARIFDKIGVSNLMDLQKTARIYNLPTT